MTNRNEILRDEDLLPDRVTEEMTGEERLLARRVRFWKTIFVFIGIGAVAGFLTGFATGFADRLQGVDALPLALLAVVGVVGGLVGLVAVSVWFFRTVDELEVADNLWASLVGFYVYAAALPSWWVLEQVAIAPPVHHWAIYALSMIAASLVYGWRKLAAR